MSDALHAGERARQCACACGQLHASVIGEPLGVYLCCCEDCQRLSGTAFAYRARFDAAQVTVTGRRSVWRRTGASGGYLAFAFCPDCGSTLLTWPEAKKEFVALSVGGFADNSFPAPERAYWTARMHRWMSLPAATRPFSGRASKA